MRGGWQRVARTFSIAVWVACFSEVPDSSLVSCKVNFVPSCEASRCCSWQGLAPRRSCGSPVLLPACVSPAVEARLSPGTRYG